MAECDRTLGGDLRLPRRDRLRRMPAPSERRHIGSAPGPRERGALLFPERYCDSVLVSALHLLPPEGQSESRGAGMGAHAATGGRAVRPPCRRPGADAVVEIAAVTLLIREMMPCRGRPILY